MSSDKLIQESPPQFGLIDLVDSFTAFRHEYRSQSRESRVTRDTLEELVQRIEKVSEGLARQITQSQPPLVNQQAASAVSEPWAMLLIEFDIQWTRAVEASVRNSDFLRKQREQADREIGHAIASLSGFRRWLSAPLIKRLRQLRSDHLTSEAMNDGLAILLSRLRQVLSEYQVERRDALGQPFDGTWMRSIGTLVDPLQPPGHVAQQISPAYFYESQIVKFADVRVASRT